MTGVAGSSAAVGTVALWFSGCFAVKYGDRLAGFDFGVAGGGIRISDKGSGDMDSASELS